MGILIESDTSWTHGRIGGWVSRGSGPPPPFWPPLRWTPLFTNPGSAPGALTWSTGYHSNGSDHVMKEISSSTMLMNEYFLSVIVTRAYFRVECRSVNRMYYNRRTHVGLSLISGKPTLSDFRIKHRPCCKYMHFKHNIGLRKT